MHITLLIPLYNEEEMLPLLVDELENFRKKRDENIDILFVNDGSKDATEELVKQLTSSISGYRVINFSRNFGHQIAVTAGLDYVEADAVIIMDADLQDPLYVAGEMIDKWKEGYDVVFGVRESREGESFFKKFTAKIFYRFFKWFTELDIPYDTGDFRLLSQPVIQAYQKVKEQNPFVRGLIAWLGYKQIGLQYKRESRKAGETKYPLKKMLKLAGNAISSFSNKPLKITIQFGMMVSVIAFLGIGWVIYVRLFLEQVVPGWASTLLIVLLIGGVQFIFMGVLGIYISKIFNEVRQRPRYLINDIWESDPHEK